MGVGGAPGERGGLLADDPRELARRVPEICAGPSGRPNRQAREMSRPDSPEGWLAPGIVGTGRGRLRRFVGRGRGADFPGDSAGRDEHEEREDPGDGHVRDPMQECNAEPDARDADHAHDDREPKRLPCCLSHLSMLEESDDLLWQRNERADFFFSSRRRHTRSVSAFLLNRSSDLSSVRLKPLNCSRLPCVYAQETLTFLLTQKKTCVKNYVQKE